MDPLTVIIGALAVFVSGAAIGCVYGSASEAHYWAAHATDTEFGVGAVHHLGRFYYVVPESEYVSSICGPDPRPQDSRSRDA